MGLKKNKKNNISLQNKMQKELSMFMERYTDKSGNVVEEVVNNPYFLVNDIWSVDFIGSIENFKSQLAIFYNKKYRERNLYLNTKNTNLLLELKYFIFKKLFSDDWSLVTIFSSRNTDIRRLIKFMDEKHPKITSLLDLDIEKVEREWLFWLVERDIPTIKKSYYIEIDKEYVESTPSAGFFRRICTEMYELLDQRNEWNKDIWDVRKLYEEFGVKYNFSSHSYKINFNSTKNEILRDNIKKYYKEKLLSKNFSWSSAQSSYAYVMFFCNLIQELEPKFNDFRLLTRQHIIDYIEALHIKANNNKRKNSNPNRYIYQGIGYINTFLNDIQLRDYEIAPLTDVRKLIFPGDKPTLNKKPLDQVDYIPDYVLEQLFVHINELHKDVQPVIWIAFKTGLRISDILGLQQDCLVTLNGKFYIETNIEKTFVQGHRIPIDDELGNILAVLIDKSIKNSNNDNNPEKYIFVRYRGSRQGKPFAQSMINKQLNILARTKNITNENGKVFHFKIHQFRHTYAVKMLNNGVDIQTVQELLAHASPEMTMRYAKLLDNTKRQAFEKVINQGVFSFDFNGEVYNITETEDISQDILEMLWRDHKLTAIDNPYGSCRARLNGNCPFAEEPPCLTCNGGKPCKDLAVGLSEMDTAKYELHIQSTSKMIEVAQLYGREELLEKNQKNLERLKDIYKTIKQGNIIFGRLDRMKRKQGVSND